MAEKEKDIGQTAVHTTPHRKLKTAQHEPHQKLGLISDALEGLKDSNKLFLVKIYLKDAFNLILH